MPPAPSHPRLAAKRPNENQLMMLRQRLSALAPIPDEEWLAFVELIAFDRLRKRALFSEIGDEQLAAGFLLDGLVRAYYRSPQGVEHILSFLGAGEFVVAFGSAIRGDKSTLAIEALEDTDVLWLDYRAWRSFTARHTCWQQIALHLAEHYYAVRERHYYEMLSMTGTMRYENFRKTSPHLMARISQRHLASFLGLTPVSLNRLVSKLRKASREI